MQVAKGTEIEDFLNNFSQEAREALNNLKNLAGPDAQTHDLPEIGKVQLYLDECSEGADRGGWVPFVLLINHTRPNGGKILLEWDSEFNWLFAGRCSTL